MATKRMLFNNAGIITEMGNAHMAQAFSQLEQQIAGAAIRMGRLTSLVQGQMVNGAIYNLYDNSQIDADLSSGYTYDATNDKVVPYTASESTLGNTASGSAVVGANNTVFEGIQALVGRNINRISVNMNVDGSIKLKRLTVNGGNYDVTEIGTFSVSTGVNDLTISPVHAVPSTGTHYIGIYYSGSERIWETSSGGSGMYWHAGEATGTGQSFPTYNANYRLALSFRFQAEAPTAVIVTTATTASATASRAMATLLLAGTSPASHVAAYVSSATSPSWTDLGTGVLVATPVGATGVGQYVFGPIDYSGHADKSMRLKITLEAGYSLEWWGGVLNWS